MLAVYAATAVIVAASLLAGAAILAALRWRGSGWLAGAVGFAALVAVAPFAIRLPGRAVTAAIVLAVALAGCAALLVARRRAEAAGGGDRADRPRGRVTPEEQPGGSGGESGRSGLLVAALVVFAVVAVAALPFALHDRVGVLGTGIYTNDHAAQLFWAEWLRTGLGPEPSAVAWGYPIGPQALTAIVAEATGVSMIAAFNGLLFAIAALTALTALAFLGGLPPVRRAIAAALAGLPYLAASFLAQSAFKETAMALFVLALAAVLPALGRSPAPGRRAAVVLLVVLAAGAIFTYSLPGLAWFALAIPLWALLEIAAGRRPFDLGRVRAALGGHRVATIAAAVALAALVALTVGPALAFVDRIGEVQQSAGRLSSPVSPGEALGIWPSGDFRIVRGEVDGAEIAIALGALAAALGAWMLVRRRELGLLAVLIAAAAVYAAARPLAEIHVEAKALAVAAPVVLLVSLRGLLSPRGPARLARYALGAVVVAAAAGSTFLALRAAPVGPEKRGEELERLAEQIEGERVAFLGVDRFAGYRLRDTLARSPAGYVPEHVQARPQKAWEQGNGVDFDTLDASRLDQFDYVITTASAHGSSPPPNFELVDSTPAYRLYRRTGPTRPYRILEHGDAPGAVLDCEQAEGERLAARGGEAVVIGAPVIAPYRGWRGPAPVEPTAGGQERAVAAPATFEQRLRLAPGHYRLSLQYHSEVPLRVTAPGLRAELPPTLDGMYLAAAGRGPYWPAGELVVAGGGGDPERGGTDRSGRPDRRPREVVVRVDAEPPTGLAEALGARRLVWLGNLVATPVAAPRTTSVAAACGAYVDRVYPDPLLAGPDAPDEPGEDEQGSGA